jgi:GT2 family glycosyltransferase
MIRFLFLNQIFLRLNLFINSENGGFAKGYNDALKQVEADYYVLLNSDIEVTQTGFSLVLICWIKDRHCSGSA